MFGAERVKVVNTVWTILEVVIIHKGIVLLRYNICETKICENSNNLNL